MFIVKYHKGFGGKVRTTLPMLALSIFPISSYADSCATAKKITHYFSGSAATGVEGTSKGLGVNNINVIPCFSIACSKRLTGSGGNGRAMVHLPGMKGLSCRAGTPKGPAATLLKTDKELTHKRLNPEPHVRCDESKEGTCVNQTGWFRCDDTGDAVGEGHFDLYVGNCEGAKSTSCKQRVDSATDTSKGKGNRRVRQRDAQFDSSEESDGASPETQINAMKARGHGSAYCTKSVGAEPRSKYDMNEGKQPVQAKRGWW